MPETETTTTRVVVPWGGIGALWLVIAVVLLAMASLGQGNIGQFHTFPGGVLFIALGLLFHGLAAL